MVLSNKTEWPHKKFNLKYKAFSGDRKLSATRKEVIKCKNYWISHRTIYDTMHLNFSISKTFVGMSLNFSDKYIFTLYRGLHDVEM